MRKHLIIVSLFAVPLAQAQMVPPIERTASVSPAMAAAPAPIELNAKEREALAIVRQWKAHPDKPNRSPDGTVMYLYGATLPTLVCTPLQVCAIRLQAGEVVNDLHVGDSARWLITPSVIGSGPSAITNAIVKPTDAGLSTNVIITTDRRSYTIKLVSAKHEWMPAIAFVYPDEHQRTWANYQKRQQRSDHATTLSTGENLANLDFNYKLSGDNPKWKPVRVYNNGTKTVIEFADSKFADEAPVLFTIDKKASLWSSPMPQLVNYRPIGNRYVVDQIIDKAALISGVGSEQVKVTIDYTGGKK